MTLTLASSCDFFSSWALRASKSRPRDVLGEEEEKEKEEEGEGEGEQVAGDEGGEL